ncbi:hypothetical protein [Pseudoflavitalea rhizosphaerae]|uniref:hypothetical protein n=1 Tax=Pseudoflavitalea rhizosphaerae TaxID=1884793 RepID=UPI000F8E3EF0|nr:hypothetical protein [Pseudoflavitalea rhizosphaerae]
MKALILFAIMLPAIGYAQSRSLAQFVTWQPNPGMEKQFEEGYKRHLDWHAKAGDTWNWYGWFFISGPRAGQFMDATIDHAWGDFDNPVDPAGDHADNEQNTVPYASFIGAAKLNAVTSLSRPGKYGLRSKYMKMITLQVLNEYSATWRIRNLRNRVEDKKGINFFVTYKTIDGGRMDHWYILIGADSWADFEACVDAGDKLLDSGVFKSMTSETLLYRHDLSRFPEEKR